MEDLLLLVLITLRGDSPDRAVRVRRGWRDGVAPGKIYTVGD